MRARLIAVHSLRQSSRCLRSLAALLMVGVGFCNGTTQARAADLELIDIVEKLQDWSSRFTSIRVVTRHWDRHEFTRQHPDLDPDEQLGKHFYSESEFLWAKWGGLRHESIYYKADVPISRTLRGIQGRRAWEASNEYGKDVALIAVALRDPPAIDTPLSANIGVELATVWDDGKGQWIDEHIAYSDRVSLEGHEDLDGHRCAVVRVITEQGPGMGPVVSGNMFFEQRYWLDIEHDFLPRKIITRHSLSGRNEDLRHIVAHYIDEFQQVDGKLWFPARGRYLPVGLPEPGWEWVLVSCTLDQSAERSLYDAPKSTRAARKKNQTEATSSPGSRATNNTSPAATAEHSAPADETPRYRALVPYWICGGVITICVAVAGVLAWKRRAT